jgi:hypothetical protein
MSSTAIRADQPIVRRQVSKPLLAAAGVFAATALLDVAGRPDLDSAGHHVSGAAAYAFTAMLLPFAAAAVVVAWRLRAGHPDDRLGRIGLGLVGAGAAAFWVCGVGSLATADSRFGGPLYPVAMIASLAGFAMLAAQALRRRTVPGWIAVAIPVAWLVGGPVGEGQLFRGAALLLAAVTVGLALTVRSPRTSPRGPARAQAVTVHA